jgi:hypothetical protein
VEKPVKNKKRLREAACYGFFILLTGLLLAIIINQKQNQQRLEKQIAALEEGVREQFIVEREILLAAEQAAADLILAQMLETETELARQTAEGTRLAGERTRGTNIRIRGIDEVYSGLLAEQQKRTLESLYAEPALIEKEKEAAGFFRAGNYKSASEAYAVIEQARPENMGAQFYRLYSLFLSNKMDRGNYGKIKEGFQALERNGYHRTEIQDVLEYISTEEGGLAGRNKGAL